MTYLFVGERRSPRARRLRVVLADGRLAAKQLFDALRAAHIEPTAHEFVNWFERGGPSTVRQCARAGLRVVALGKKVERELSKRGIEHLALVHPAARGKIRKKARYAAHVKGVLA